MSKNPSRLAEEVEITLHPMESLLAPKVLDRVQGVLREILPTWSKKLAASLDEWSRQKFYAFRRGTLQRAVRRVIAPGETYRELEEEFGAAPYERDLGAVTLTGASRGVLIVMMTDDWVITPGHTGYLWGNFISIHVSQSEIEGLGAIEWVQRACTAFCDAIAVGHGFANVEKEYEARNKVGYTYTGLDPTRYIPGLYWLNVFGAPYVKLIGKKKLMATPGAQTESVEGHVIARFGDDPRNWKTRAYRESINRAIKHVGPQYFFDKTARRRKTVAPTFKHQIDQIPNFDSPDDSPKAPFGNVIVDVEAKEIRVEQGRKVRKRTPLTGMD